MLVLSPHRTSDARRCPMRPTRFTWLAATTLLIFAPEAFAQQPKGRKVAFLVGVGTYKHNFADLGKAPEKDVTELAKVFKDGGFEVVLLTGSADGKDQATKANVEDRFQAVLKGTGNPAGALGKGDVLVVALCGHGQQIEAPDPATGRKEEQPFFCPVDGRPDDLGTL